MASIKPKPKFKLSKRMARLIESFDAAAQSHGLQCVAGEFAEVRDAAEVNYDDTKAGLIKAVLNLELRIKELTTESVALKEQIRRRK